MNTSQQENAVRAREAGKSNRFRIEPLEERIAPDTINGAINEKDPITDDHFVITPSGNLHTLPG